eukprot:snap_masked-scaffold_14-processed-gene-4.43-mRNA-1 protein AED:1.00 eAED:1.00 QI:0/-1/0/0/-1/1/1/0/129
MGLIQVDVDCLPMNSTFGRPDIELYFPFLFNTDYSSDLPQDGMLNEELWCPIVEEYSNYEENVKRKWGYCIQCPLCQSPPPTQFPTFTLPPEDDTEIVKGEDNDLNALFWIASFIMTCPCFFIVYIKKR